MARRAVFSKPQALNERRHESALMKQLHHKAVEQEALSSS
jgi:hypothetical protein